MTVAIDQAGQLGWLINNFAMNTPGVQHALVVSADGLELASSTELDRDTTERLSALTSGLVSLTRGAADICGQGRVNQTLVDMENGYLFVMAISDGSSLAVLTGGWCDIGLVAYEAARLVDQAGPMLTPAVRAEMRKKLLDWHQRI
ncbi:roadblock/LC7 domain-containing protein [Streptomyces pathocidini]|uniref:Roadblock/LC7 domain-containing protein n=1 Tax=Streptomyces pathocidini TaxID=1650571 RepID=A0ABW7UNT7_9ACTN|nr:roadblock/LC7 domain-containing protein [Streptomyces pathocidini]